MTATQQCGDVTVAATQQCGDVTVVQLHNSVVTW